MSYRLASGVELVEARGGPALFTWTPLRLVRVNTALAGLLEGGGDLVPRSSGEARALEALLERGFLAYEPTPSGPGGRSPTVSVVIPVKDRAEELRRCLESLTRVRYPGENVEVLVVDDGSRDETRDVARAMGASVILSGGEGRGPAAARNRGASQARGEVLAFLDSDCAASEEWLAELAPMFQDPDVAAVGGRVNGMHASSALDRYEAEMSSLCLGARGRSGQHGKDTFYLPSCNLLVRRRDFADSGGFREELQVAEDVDLSWRLRDRGRKIVYTPAGSIVHEHRNRLGAFLRRRFQYGTSEGLLQILHPERRKRLILPPALAASALLVALSWLRASWFPAALGAAAVAVDVFRLWKKLRRQTLLVSPKQVLRARLRTWGSLVYYVSFHFIRYYAAVLIVMGIAWPRLGALALAMALWAGVADYRLRRPALGFPVFFGIYMAEHMAYGAGVFWGCLRQGTFRSYRPVVSARG
ncbi:MAG: mycofactocin system glycosyltransferase [Anaeromyxobacter sp. RBG_16_69_14]|nr:MAG: mycofactocin system glycosyltransferase [Anaeromyxobacter sp. RBG_16_69_14]